MNEHLLHFVSDCKYLGVSLVLSLNVKEHLYKVLKSAATRIKLLKAMRKSLTRHAAESVYKVTVLPKMLCCSRTFRRILDTMGNKFENLQAKASKIIYCCPQCRQEHGFLTILNHKKVKAALLMFECLHETAVTNFASYCERVSHSNGTKGNKVTLTGSEGQDWSCKEILLVPRPCLFQRITSWNTKPGSQCCF